MNQSEDYIEDLIQKGRYFEARQLAEATIESTGENDKLIQLLALATSKSGSAMEAKEILEPLYNRDKKNAETSGILAGIYKEIFRIDKDPNYGNLAYTTYLTNFQLTQSFYTGINAASMSRIMGRASEAKRISEQILNGLGEHPNNFWDLATKAEAHLILKQYEKATEFYLETRKEAHNDWGKINSISNQLWLLKHFMYVPDEIINLYKPPVIASFIGHMVDQPGRKNVRFHNEMVPMVSDAIRAAIRTYSISIGYCSLACGADILFAEAMIEAGNEVQIFIPFQREEFLEISVRGGGEDWVERYHKIEEKVKINYLTEEPYRSDDQFFLYLGKLLFGASVLRAKKMSTKPVLLSVLSAFDLSNATGGTRNMLKEWPYKDRIYSINIDDYRNPNTPIDDRDVYEPNINKQIKENRTIYYILLVYLQRIDQPISTEPLYLHPEIFEESDILFKQVTLNNQFTAVLYTSQIIITDLAQKIAQFYSKETDFQYKIGLHVGPVTLKEQKATGIPLEIAVEICTAALPNSINCSRDFASHLMLESQGYPLNYSGYVVRENQKIESYVFGNR